jgi:hypothetical protein
MARRCIAGRGPTDNRTRAIRYAPAAYRRKKTGPKAGFLKPHAVSGARAPRDI